VKLRWLLPLTVVPLCLGLGAWQGYRWWTWSISPVSDRPDAIIRLAIPPGTPAQQIGADLEQAGVIRSAEAWSLWVRWRTWRVAEGGFQAGTYDFDATETTLEIAEQIWNGEVIQQRYTIPEGRSISEMAAYFEQEGFFSAEAFTAAANAIPREEYPWLPESITSLEGFLYPDTYQTATEALSPEEVVRQMLDRFETVALPVYQAIQNPSLGLLEWVTLGSIVEKEAVVAEERRRIAGVFTQRLQKGMALASDPTVEYALGIRQTVDKPLTFAQVETPSPYNTYLNPGLPPGPIASPGIASLKATLDPEPTEFLYFMARYDGTHIFSRTMAEHEAAIDQVVRDLKTRDVE
jgi:UPF0755 protein